MSLVVFGVISINSLFWTGVDDLNMGDLEISVTIDFVRSFSHSFSFTALFFDFLCEETFGELIDNPNDFLIILLAPKFVFFFFLVSSFFFAELSIWNNQSKSYLYNQSGILKTEKKIKTVKMKKTYPRKPAN